MNQTFRGGAALHRLVEDAPVELLPEFAGLERSEGHLEEETMRAAVHGHLTETEPRRARELEDEAARVSVMADQGTWALTCVAEERLDGADLHSFNGQRDALGRSLWCHANARTIFDDAESIHYAARYRGYGKLYAAFEIPEPGDLVWSDGLRNRLAEQIVHRLDLSGACTVSHVMLPKNGKDAAEHALIVRHPGPLSSIPVLLDDGRRKRHYYTPPNEATLIYSPADGMVEVCAASPGVREKLGTCFAVIGLGQDLSHKPITYKFYDLSRFSKSLRLPQVDVEGFSIEPPKVVEADLRPQHPQRRLSLKVARDDDIEAVANELLGEGFFRRSGQIVRVGISVRYRRPEDKRTKSLALTVSYPNSSNLRSLGEPQQRELASALLKAWGVLETFRSPSPEEKRAVLPSLIELYALPTGVFLGSDLKARGLDVETLARQGFLVPHGRHEMLLIEPDDEGPEEVGVEPGEDPERGIYRGADGRTASVPVGLVDKFKINRAYVEETIADELKPCFARWSSARIDDNLAFLGELDLPSGSTPCYLARVLESRSVFERLDVRLRGEDSGKRGIVLDAGNSGLSFVAGNVLLPLTRYLAGGGGRVLDLDATSSAFDRLRRLAKADGSVDLIPDGANFATLIVPGRPPLQLITPIQVGIFRKLVDAHKNGTPNVRTSELMQGSSSRSPQNAFTPDRWAQIKDIYMEKVGGHSGWRLIVEPSEI